MLRTLVVLPLLAGLVLCGAGVALLWADGSNVTSPDFWIIAVEVMISIPGEAITRAAGGGENALLYRGLVIVAMGVVLPILIWIASLATWGIVASVAAVGSAVSVVTKSARKGQGTRQRPEKERGRDIRKIIGGWRRKAPEKGMMDLESQPDEVMDLEDASAVSDRPGKRWATRRFADWLPALLSGMRGRKSGRLDLESVALEEEEIACRSVEPEMRRWYDVVRQGGVDEVDMILKARSIKERLSDAERDEIVEKEPMSGEFMIRMLEAWAGREPAAEADEASEDKGSDDAAHDIVSAALRPDDIEAPDLENDAPIDLESDDTFLDDETARSVFGDLGDVDGDVGEIADARSEEVEESRAESDTDAASVERRIADLLAVIYPSMTKPRALLDQEDIDDLRSALSELDDETRAMEPDDLEALIEEHGESPAWKWLAENLTRLSECLEDQSQDDVVEDESAQEETGENWPANNGVSTEDAPPFEGDVSSDADSDRVPRNVGLGELEEVEACDDILTRWGYMAKGAGASEAKLVHSVIEREGAKRRVAGIVHVVATWRDDDGEEVAKASLIFRRVPEGEWRLAEDGTATLVSENGDWVGVSDRIIDHKDCRDSRVIVHFYGPGAPDNLDHNVRDGVRVISDVLTEEEIRSEIGFPA